MERKRTNTTIDAQEVVKNQTFSPNRTTKAHNISKQESETNDLSIKKHVDAKETSRTTIKVEESNEALLDSEK